MTKETTAPTIHEQIGTAERALHELEVEREQLPGLIQAAAREADAPALVKHRTRFNEIDLYLGAQRVSLARLRKTSREVKQADLDSEAGRLAELNAKAGEKFEAAREARDAARNAFELANAQAADNRQRVGDLGRELERLMHEIQPSGRPHLHAKSA